MVDFIQTNLTELCSIRDIHNSVKGDVDFSNRLKFIKNKLSENNIFYWLDIFEIYKEKYYNLIIPFTDEKYTDSIILTAHYDISNINSDNCLDNSSSIINLLYIINNLNELKNQLNKNIFCIFSAGEEVGGLGSQYVSSQLYDNIYGNVKGIINLELTAFGKTIIIEDNKNELDKLIYDKLSKYFDVVKERMPFNESFIYNLHNIPSCTLSLGNKTNNKIDLSHWKLCHSIEDKIELANFEDMEIFCDILLILIIQIL